MPDVVVVVVEKRIRLYRRSWMRRLHARPLRITAM